MNWLKCVPFHDWVILHCIHMYHGFFIHSSVDGHLGCFHVLAIVNSGILFSKAVTQFYIPRNSVWEFQFFPYPCQSLFIVHRFDHSHPIDFPLYLSGQSLLTNQPNDFFFLFLFTNYKVLLRKILYSWPLVSPPPNWSSIAIRVIFYFWQGRGLHWVFFAPHRLSGCGVWA